MSKEFKTFGQVFYLEEASFIERTKRDIRLLMMLSTVVIRWFKARKIRAEFARCRAQGEPFYVDRFTPPEPKK